MLLLAAAVSVQIIWGVQIPMRDGVHLNATVYKMPGAEKLPELFVMTPYIADHDHARAMYFAQHGYAFALVDCRGRGNSEGTFEVGAHDATDGYDTVEWFAKQPWCDGKVAMWGGSYMGFDQWATVKELPSHLVTIVPASAAHQGIDTPAPGGIFTSDNFPWLALVAGKALNRNLSVDDDYWDPKYRQIYANHLPYRTLMTLSGLPTAMFEKWFAHPTYDAYWKAMAPTREQYAKLSIPILTITGDYDAQQVGALSYYREHMQYGSAEAKAKHDLIIGPWDHAGTRTPQKEFMGLTFGDRVSDRYERPRAAVVRLDDEERTEAGVSQIARRVLRRRIGGVALRRRLAGHRAGNARADRVHAGSLHLRPALRKDRRDRLHLGALRGCDHGRRRSAARRVDHGRCAGHRF